MAKLIIHTCRKITSDTQDFRIYSSSASFFFFSFPVSSFIYPSLCFPSFLYPSSSSFKGLQSHVYHAINYSTRFLVLHLLLKVTQMCRISSEAINENLTAEFVIQTFASLALQGAFAYMAALISFVEKVIFFYLLFTSFLTFLSFM